MLLRLLSVHILIGRNLDLCDASAQSGKTNISVEPPDCRERNAVINAHCRLMISFTLSNCFDWCLDMIIIQLCSSAQQPEWRLMATTLQPLADGLCSIDPISLIKVVYRGNTATSDG